MMKSLLGHDHHDRNSARETLIRYTIPFNLMDFESKSNMIGGINKHTNQARQKANIELPQLIIHDKTPTSTYQLLPTISTRSMFSYRVQSYTCIYTTPDQKTDTA